MPTILVSGPYRFFFYSGDGEEPSHVHVRRDKMVAKFWLSPVRLERSGGFTRVELRHLQRLTEANVGVFQERWDEFFQD